VRTVLDADLPAGDHAADWDGRDERGHVLPQGLYFIRLSGGGATRVVRFVLLR
jgi:flagellar hook assembly protein FlgD